MGLNMNHVGKPRDKKMLHAMIMAALIKTRSHSCTPNFVVPNSR